MVGKRWRQECEVAEHTASAVRKQGGVVADTLAFSFAFSPGSQFKNWWWPHSEWTFSPQLKLSRVGLKAPPRGLLVLLSPAKLTVKTKYHAVSTPTESG